MFTVTSKQEQYLTYTLADDRASSFLEIVPERGAIVTNWRLEDKNILYLDRERFANPQLSIRGGIPILFPICGNLPDNNYIYQGQQYNLKQHGFARDLPWQVTATQTENNAGITLVLNSNSQTYAVYPIDFELTFTYLLRGNSLKIKQHIVNLSQQTMPFSIGLHPYFQTTDKTQLDFDIPASAYQNQISKEIETFDGRFNLDLEELDLAFNSIDRHFTLIVDRQRKINMKISYSDLYTTLVFWTIKGKDYVCLEPWSAPRNSLNTGEKLTYLEPGSVCEGTIEIEIENF